MLTAYAYVDRRTAIAAAKAVSDAAQRGRESAGQRMAYFEQKCIKKMNKRRSAKFVSVPCKPVQGDGAQAAAIDMQQDVLQDRIQDRIADSAGR
jgi:hypothetical protein